MPATPTPPPPHHRHQRERFLALLAERGAAAVIPTHTTKVRSNDSDFRFRPGSDFWWLTGFGEPDAWLVLLPDGPGGKGEGPRSVLFLRPRDRERETWDGRRLGVERAAEILGIDEARDIAVLWRDLPELLAGYANIVWRLGEEPERDRRIGELTVALRRRARGSARGFRALLDPTDSLHELRLVKSEAELGLMRHAAKVASARAGVHCAGQTRVRDRGVPRCVLPAPWLRRTGVRQHRGGRRQRVHPALCRE